MKKYNKYLVIGLCLVAVIICCGIALSCCTKSDGLPPAPVTEEKYKTLAKKWQDDAEKFPARFQLIGERGGTDENIIKSFNNWLQAFKRPENSVSDNELAAMEKEYGKTTFHKWEEFRKAHYRNYAINLTPKMNHLQLAEEINNYIGLGSPSHPQDSISDETVKTIVYMNSLCAFFEGEKDRLHRENIDTVINECKKLGTGGKYPSLDRLID